MRRGTKGGRAGVGQALCARTAWLYLGTWIQMVPDMEGAPDKRMQIELVRLTGFNPWICWRALEPHAHHYCLFEQHELEAQTLQPRIQRPTRQVRIASINIKRPHYDHTKSLG